MLRREVRDGRLLREMYHCGSSGETSFRNMRRRRRLCERVPFWTRVAFWYARVRAATAGQRAASRSFFRQDDRNETVIRRARRQWVEVRGQSVAPCVSAWSL